MKDSSICTPDSLDLMAVSRQRRAGRRRFAAAILAVGLGLVISLALGHTLRSCEP